MQRRHSAVVANGDGALSREERRAERRRLGKARRANGGSEGDAVGRKLRRVKRVAKSKKRDPRPVILWAVLSFGLFSTILVTVFRLLHSDSGGGPTRRRAYPSHERTGWKPRSHTEYNSDKVSSGFMSKLRGGGKYLIPDSMRELGNKQKWYGELRKEYDLNILPKDDERSLRFVEEERKKNEYRQHSNARTPYDIHNCPEFPPDGYPTQWPVLEVLDNWSPDDPTPHEEIYQGWCVFDYMTEKNKANNYRHAELPFIMRNDPAAARTAERWNHPGYLDKLLMGNEDKMRRAEYSPNNHFMYWVDKRDRSERRAAKRTMREAEEEGNEAHDGFGRGAQAEMAKAMEIYSRVNDLKDKLEDAQDYADEHEDDDEAQLEVKKLRRQLKKAKELRDKEAENGWKPPTENIRMLYTEWLAHANVTDDKLGPDNPHWYFRLIGCGSMGDGDCDKGSSEWLFDELTYFQPRMGEERPFYLIEPKQQKGIHCRFGMKGVIAENHFDLSRNAISLLGGQRRYILAHPNQCVHMNLLPRGHPSARHSAVDWSDPDLESFPTFKHALVNEVVMQAGDVMYLPTNWFHYIISLDLNFQCNTRSGGEHLYREEINECGF